MTKDFRSYLIQHEQTQFYRVKTVTPIGDFGATAEDRETANANLLRIEHAIQKYDPVSIERVKKTIIQRCPLDFINIQNKQVFILDLELGMRVSPIELQHLITVILDVPENYVVVYGESDPHEVTDQVTAAMLDIETEASKKHLIPVALLDDPEHLEADTPETITYGDAYNSRLLQYFQGARRAVNTEDTSSDGINDSVAEHPTHVECGEAPHVRTIRRTYRDENGKLWTLTRKLDRFGEVNEI